MEWIVPLNLNGARSRYCIDTGDPSAWPTSRQSLAVKIKAAGLGTMPSISGLPLRVHLIDSGPLGLSSVCWVRISSWCQPAASDFEECSLTRSMMNRFVLIGENPLIHEHREAA